jgi:hypothetical protein
MVMMVGVERRVYVGLSSDKIGEKFVCCKFKGFWVKLIFLGLVGF